MENKILMVAVSVIIAVTITAGALVPIIADVSSNEGDGGTPITYGEQGTLELGLFDSTYSVNLGYSTYDGDDSGKYTCTLDSVNGESVDTESIKFTPNQIVFASTTCTLYAHATTDVSDYIQFSIGYINSSDQYDKSTCPDNVSIYYDSDGDSLYLDMGGDGYYPKSGTTWYIRPVFPIDGPNTGLIQRGIYNYANGSAYVGETTSSIPVVFSAISTQKSIVTSQATTGSTMGIEENENWYTATISLSYTYESGIVSDVVATATISSISTTVDFPATYTLGLADHPNGDGGEGNAGVPSSITTILSVVPLLVIVGIVLMVVGAYKKA